MFGASVDARGPVQLRPRDRGEERDRRVEEVVAKAHRAIEHRRIIDEADRVARFLREQR